MREIIEDVASTSLTESHKKIPSTYLTSANAFVLATSTEAKKKLRIGWDDGKARCLAAHKREIFQSELKAYAGLHGSSCT